MVDKIKPTTLEKEQTIKKWKRIIEDVHSLEIYNHLTICFTPSFEYYGYCTLCNKMPRVQDDDEADDEPECNYCSLYPEYCKYHSSTIMPHKGSWGMVSALEHKENTTAFIKANEVLNAIKNLDTED